MGALIAATSLVPSPHAHAQDQPDSALRMALVQFEVTPERYRSLNHFSHEVERLISSAVNGASADVVIFPEYINVFALFSEYSDILTASDTILDAVEKAAVRAGISPAAGNLLDVLRRLVRQEARQDRSRILALWSRLADTYDVVVVAGTTFAMGDAGSLRNRLLVFGPAGNLRYTQDKVYLTPFETNILNLQPGAIRSAETINIENLDVAFTICRDTFFDPWEERLQDADLWIELRANGEPYSSAVRNRFLGGLTERVTEAKVPYGLSASLNGSYLGLVWEGPSYVVTSQGKRIAETRSPRREDILLFDVPMTIADGDDSKEGPVTGRPDAAH